jgi:large subunit ribosomal protein L7/L12
MAEVNQQQVIDYIKNISVLELSQLVKKHLEASFGVSAAAAVPMACRWRGVAPAWRRHRWREGPISRHADRSGHRQDQGHQGRPGSHQPRTEGSQGFVVSAPKPIKEGRAEGRGWKRFKKKFDEVGVQGHDLLFVLPGRAAALCGPEPGDTSCRARSV